MAQQASKFNVKCYKKRSHDDDEWEKIKAAITLVLTDNDGYSSGGLIKERLKKKGFEKIMIWDETNNDNVFKKITFDLDGMYGSSYWEVNDKRYGIYTDMRIV